MKTVMLLALLAGGCDVEAQHRNAAWNGPCHDQSTLLATTTGSPNQYECPNKHHKMRVQVMTTPSNEEAAALAFCECIEPVVLPDAGSP